MNTIYLSDSGPKVSPAIYGFYRWREEEVTVENVERIVNLSLELGINTFDHADIYGGYQAEKVFGQVIKNSSVNRENIVIFSKSGYNVPHPSKPQIRVSHHNTSSSHIVESVEQSLKNLQTDYIDVYLVNGLDPLSDLEETALTLRRLKDAGKIKNIGVVNFSVFQHQLLS